MWWMALLACTSSNDVELIQVEEPAVEDIVVLQPADPPVEAAPVAEHELIAEPEEPIAAVTAPPPRPVSPATPEAEPVTTQPETTQPEEEAPPLPATWTSRLTPKGSSLYVQVFKDRTTAAADLSHDHVMQATGWTGTAVFNVADLSQCSLELSVPVDKLAVDPPNLRKALGLEGELSDDNRKDIQKNMLGKDQLDAAKHPNITYASTRCEQVGDKVRVTGTLTIKGSPQPVTSLMTIEADQDGFRATGSLTSTQSAFGITPFSAMLGALKNQDTLQFTVAVSGTP